MTKHNASNERIKHQYFGYLREAQRYSEATVDDVAKALARFEADTGHKDFRNFHREQARAFKGRLIEQISQSTGQQLSKATVHGTLAHLKRFFVWLAGQPGYKSRLRYSDADYFNLPEKDTRVAMARRQRAAPTVDQVKHVIRSMPAVTEIDRRNRALVAFTLLTGARDRAIASLKLKHVDLTAGSVYQDAREVKTKFSKSFTTYFFPVGREMEQELIDWLEYLRTVKGWTNEDPLFPATEVALGASQQFQVAGLSRKHWASAAPIRTIFREGFQRAGLPYFNPHRFRSTLVQLGEKICRTPEEFKAWSQNLGHEGVLTTFYSYGSVSERRQGEIVRSLGDGAASVGPEVDRIAQAVLSRMREVGFLTAPTEQAVAAAKHGR